MPQEKQFVGKTVVITGASRGIGAAMAIEFAQQGASLILGYQHDSPTQKEMEQKIKGFTKNVYWFKGDVAQEETSQKLCQLAVDKFGTIDCAIANAGILHFAPFPQIKPEEMDRLIAVNQKGAYFFLKAVGSVLKKAKKGSVVTLSSTVATRVVQMYAFYAGTKAFLEAITKGFAIEYAPYGIRANVIAAGVVDTEMNRVMLASAQETIRKGILLNRVATPAEIAKVAVYLCSEEAAFINGQVIQVDGGSMQGL